MSLLVELIFPRRLPRFTYFLRTLASNLALGLLVAGSSPSAQVYSLMGVAVVGVYQLVFIILPRVRDTGMSGWRVWLSVVPFVYIFLSNYSAVPRFRVSFQSRYG